MKMALFVCSTAMTLMAAGSAPDQPAKGSVASTQATASARLVAPVKVDVVQPLNFGIVLVKDIDLPSTVKIDFEGDKWNWATLSFQNKVQDPKAKFNLVNCSWFRGTNTAKPARVQLQGDTWALNRFGYSLQVQPNVVLSGDHGPDALLSVDTDLPPEDFVPAQKVVGVDYAAFQLGGTLLIPPRALGAKTGQINVSLAYK